MNCLLIVIKFIINLKNNSFIDCFNVIIYLIEYLGKLKTKILEKYY